MYKCSLHHVFLCLCGSLFFFVSACSQHNTKNNGVVKTPAATEAAPPASPEKEANVSNGHPVTTTSNANPTTATPLATAQQKKKVRFDQSEEATPASTTTSNANPTTATPLATAQQEEGVSVDQSENETPNGAGLSSSAENPEGAVVGSSSSDSNLEQEDKEKDIALIKTLNELDNLFGSLGR